MAKLKGKDLVLYISRSGQMIPVCCGRDLSISIGSEALEVTKTPTSQWRSFIYGIKEYSISASGIAIIDDSFTVNDFFAAMNNRETVAFIALHNEEQNLFWSGNLIITNIEQTAPYKDVLTYSITATGDGELKNVNEYMIEIMTDENGNPITDENGNIIYSQDSGSLLPIDLNINC